MRTLIISTYPPANCGIGLYTRQQAEAMRAEGQLVDILCPHDGDGDHCVDLLGGLHPLRMLKYIWAYDDTIIHFTPFYFYRNDSSAFDRLLTSLALLIVVILCGRKISWLIHETAFAVEKETRPKGTRRLLDRWIWRLSRRIIFHSEREKKAFISFYSLPAKRMQFEIWSPHKFFVPNCKIEKNEARKQLGIPEDRLMLLCIGFVQPHKGFDRPMRAVIASERQDLLLKVVGSVRLDWDKAYEYARDLHDLASADERIEFVEGFISDEMFDMWIIASDYVILPYHEINTSGVAGRAALLDRPVLCAAVGGLQEQMIVAGSHTFSDEDSLKHLLAAL